MKIYRRLRSRTVRTAISLLIAALPVCIALSLILSDLTFALAVTGGAYILGATGLLFFRGNIRLELEVGRLRYYKSGRLRGNYFMSTCKFKTHIDCDFDKAGDIVGEPKLELFVSSTSDFSGKKTKLDCTPIGLAQFQDLIDTLRLYYEKSAEREGGGYDVPGVRHNKNGR